MKTKLFLLSLVMCVHNTHGQMLQAKLTPDDGAPDDRFGQTVSISEGYAVIGAKYDDDNGFSSGAAYVFRREGFSWVQDAKLLPADGTGADNFGYSVSISGERAIVGAHHSSDDGGQSGSAYIFRREGSVWVEEAKLTASDAAPFDWFGYSVAISADYAVVGAVLDDLRQTTEGSAYVFRREGSDWLEETKLIASDRRDGDQFGGAVSISANYVVVGSASNDDHGTSSGTAYIFGHDGSQWFEEAILTASDAQGFDYFGFSVSISGDRALVGAYGNDDDRGSAYVFKSDGLNWAEEAKLLASDGVAYDHFGRAVSLTNACAIVAAPYDDNRENESGSVYVFRLEDFEWVEHLKITARDAEPIDYFGWSVSMSGDEAVMGILNDPHAGSAYVCTGFADDLSISVILSPASGTGSFDYSFGLSNNTDSLLTMDVWTKAVGPNGGQKTGGVVTRRTINPGVAYFDSGSHALGVGAPNGEYVFTVYVGEYPDEIMDSSNATYTKTPLEKGSLAEGKGSPDAFELSDNYPNPFNPSTTIRYQLPVDAHVILTVSDIVGREVARLVNGPQEAGYKSVSFDGSNLASGIYFYRLQAGSFMETRKLVMMK